MSPGGPASTRKLKKGTALEHHFQKGNWLKIIEPHVGWVELKNSEGIAQVAQVSLLYSLEKIKLTKQMTQLKKNLLF